MFIKHCKLPLSFLENLTDDKKELRNYIEIQGVSVKTFSKRFPIFQQSQTCYICGLKATYLSVETDGQSVDLETGVLKNYNINMYNDEEVLFTVDHVIPLSKGGKNHSSNLKTCCSKCNFKKGAN
jgi:hypothetical protein